MTIGPHMPPTTGKQPDALQPAQRPTFGTEHRRRYDATVYKISTVDGRLLGQVHVPLTSRAVRLAAAGPVLAWTHREHEVTGNSKVGKRS